MPHIIVKLWPGKPEELKKKFADAIVQQGAAILGKGEEYFSVAIEEIPQEDWAEQVYKPEIVGQEKKLYRQPGYKM